MRHAGILIVLGFLLAAGSCGRKPSDLYGDSKQPETGPKIAKVAEAAEPPQDASAMRVPPGFKAKDGTIPEPYSKTGWAKEIAHEKTGMEMVFIPAGEFMMGSPAGEEKRSGEEGPVHHVRITKPFYMGKYEVTRGEWRKVLQDTPSNSKGSERLPAGGITWDDCQEFLGKVGGGFSLPAEAQWEYACRAGTRTPFHTGDTISTDDANYNGERVYGNGQKGVFRNYSMEVGSFKPNAFGLCDMHGNMLEWCADWYGSKYYAESPENDPPGPNEGKNRVQRGGSSYFSPGMCRSASRIGFVPSFRHGHSGFRLALDLK